MKFAETIKTKSDQLNADDFIGKDALIITITKVDCKDSQDQPVAIHYEGDNGKPYKPCLSMRKLIAHAWGVDESKFIGRSLSLYRDASVKWAGENVGGIRINAMSDIDSKLRIALQESKMKRKIIEVEKLEPQVDAKRIKAEKFVESVLSGEKEADEKAVAYLEKDYPDLLEKLNTAKQEEEPEEEWEGV
jgi:hypothetical protein